MAQSYSPVPTVASQQSGTLSRHCKWTFENVLQELHSEARVVPCMAKDMKHLTTKVVRRMKQVGEVGSEEDGMAEGGTQHR